ncbi:MAG TPA: hypothetical protein VKP65_17625 [Rhodothermales bacterium]|nr:hypothetical protein [Rhodothermales bacterium]
MIERTVEASLRRFLLVVAGCVFAGTVVELLFVGHAESIIQLVPFVLCAVGALVVVVAFYAPRRRSLRALRGVMVLMVLGSGFGIYEHLTHNFAFELEIRPNATVGDVFWEALAGASPLIAPGILALAAVLAIAATYRHPLLEKAREKS